MAGPKWKAKDYTDLLSLLFVLTKTMKTKGVVAIESHIEKPHESKIFEAYPKILKDHFATDLICDTLRMMTMNLEDPHQVEDAIEKQIEKHHHEAHGAAHAIQNMADAMPALGIVAAVLGIIKTMGSIDQPPVYLGKLIGSALLAQHRVQGRIAFAEKPDILWDHPELGRFYEKLEDEYEIVERGTLLNGKLDVIGTVAETFTDMMDTARSTRLELLIVGLILAELVIGIVALFR